MEQYKTDAEIYAVLEREIIDLTIRPGSPLSENPLCARFGAPRTLIRMVLQRLKESGLVRIVPYKGTTVTRLNRRIVDELIYERTAVEAKVLRDFPPKCAPEQRALIRVRVDAYEALARAEACLLYTSSCGTMVMALVGQTVTHSPQPMQSRGDTALSLIHI